MICILLAVIGAYLLGDWLDRPLRNEKQASEAVDDQWGAERITFQRDGGATVHSNGAS